MNKNLLLSILAAKGENQKILAEALGITRVTLCKKISGKSNASFTQPEIAAIRKRYELADETVTAIFFAD